MDFFVQEEEDVGFNNDFGDGGFMFLSQESVVSNAASGGVGNGKGGESFQCENCGSNSAYEDESGKLVCNVCHSQSQTVAYSQETVMDYEEVMALGAKTSKGHLISKKLYNTGRRKKAALTDLDASQPLPDLKKCICGFQSILKKSVVIISNAVGLKIQEQNIFMESVRKIWVTYMIAYRDGAEKYGAMYPDLRFSMRDSFLPHTHRQLLSRVLSHKATMDVQRIIEEENELLEDEDDSNNNNDDDENKNSNNKKTRNEVAPAAVSDTMNQRSMKRKQITSIKQLLRKLVNKGREEAAISLFPSMEFAAAIIWLGISRIGITPGQIVHWIANGVLPYLNAYDSLLSSDEQKDLALIGSFFRMRAPPKPSLIEKLAAYLAVACRVKPTKHVPQMSEGADNISTDDEKTEVSRDLEATNRPQILERLRFVSSECVPLMIGQLVANLRLGQNVLDIALSLIGIQNPRKPGRRPLRLPPPLTRAHPRKVSTPEHALAVIVVACKMTPGWENWYYVQPPPDRSSTESSDNSTNRDNFNSTQRFIPWNEQQFAFLRNDDVSGYLSFIEEMILPESEFTSTFPELTSLLDEACKTRNNAPVETDSDISSNDRSIPKRSNYVLLEGLSNDKHKELLNHYSKGFTPYLLYPDTKSHTRVERSQKLISGVGFHKFYSRLIEYMAYKTRVDAYRIHELVAMLDEEVVALCNNRGEFTDPEEKRKKLNKIKREQKRRRIHERKSRLASLRSSSSQENFLPMEALSGSMEQSQFTTTSTENGRGVVNSSDEEGSSSFGIL